MFRQVKCMITQLAVSVTTHNALRPYLVFTPTLRSIKRKLCDDPFLYVWISVHILASSQLQRCITPCEMDSAPCIPRYSTSGSTTTAVRQHRRTDIRSRMSSSVSEVEILYKYLHTRVSETHNQIF